MKKIIMSSPLKVKSCGRILKKDSIFVIFGIILLIGVICGAISGRNADRDLIERLDFIFRTNQHIRCTEGILSIFVSSFGTSGIFLSVSFLSGLTVWGGLLAWGIPFLKGYGYGLSVGYLYGVYGLYGIGYNLLMILPGAFVSAVATAAAADTAMRNSVEMAAIFVKGEVRNDPHIQMVKYMKTMIWILVIYAVSGIIDMLLGLCFSWLFKSMCN